MRIYPPLTAFELAAIYDAEPTPNVLRLLQEIHRLHNTIRRADQIRQMIGPTGSAYVAGTVWQCFERELNEEPCLKLGTLTPRQEARLERRHQRRMGANSARKNGGGNDAE